MDSLIYLGPLGALRALPDQLIDVASTMGRVGASHVSLTGNTVTDTYAMPLAWAWSWDTLLPGQVQYIRALHAGIVGGPLWVLDPRQINRLPFQIASGGSQRRSPTGFTVTAGALRWVPVQGLTLDSTPIPVAGLGLHSPVAGTVQWTLSTAGGGVLSASDGRYGDELRRAPILPGEALTVTGMVAASQACTVRWRWWEYAADGTPTLRTSGGRTLKPGRWRQVGWPRTPSATTAATSCPQLEALDDTPAGTVLATTMWQVAPPDADVLPTTLVSHCTPADDAVSWFPGGGSAEVTVPEPGDHSTSYPWFHKIALAVIERVIKA